MTSDLDAINRYIHEQIPITAAMGARVESYTASQIVIAAPLAPNLNHKKTAFGGSLATLAILSGWTLVHLKLREEEISNELVIQRSSFDFLKPVEGDFRASAELADPGEWDRFIKVLKRRGMGRITIQSRIDGPDGLAGEHEGVYVAIKQKSD